MPSTPFFRTTVGALLILLLVMLAASYFDNGTADDLSAEAELYCGNVHAGVWPDYKGSYRHDCDNNGKLKPKGS